MTHNLGYNIHVYVYVLTERKLHKIINVFFPSADFGKSMRKANKAPLFLKCCLYEPTQDARLSNVVVFGNKGESCRTV